MYDVPSRLTKCFAAVFPSLPEDKFPLAEPSTVDGWDSVASVTLIATIEEEFAIELDLQEAGSLMSFEKMLKFLENRPAGNG